MNSENFNVGCENCCTLRKTEQLDQNRTQLTSEFVTLKQKIIATDKLIREYQSSKFECDKLSKKNEELTRFIDKLHKDLSSRNNECATLLEEVEPLKKANSKLKLEADEANKLASKCMADMEAKQIFTQQLVEKVKILEKYEEEAQLYSSKAKEQEKLENKLETVKDQYKEAKESLNKAKKEIKQLQNKHKQVIKYAIAFGKIAVNHGKLNVTQKRFYQKLCDGNEKSDISDDDNESCTLDQEEENERQSKLLEQMLTNDDEQSTHASLLTTPKRTKSPTAKSCGSQLSGTKQASCTEPDTPKSVRSSKLSTPVKIQTPNKITRTRRKTSPAVQSVNLDLMSDTDLTSEPEQELGIQGVNRIRTRSSSKNSPLRKVEKSPSPTMRFTPKVVSMGSSSEDHLAKADVSKPVIRDATLAASSTAHEKENPKLELGLDLSSSSDEDSSLSQHLPSPDKESSAIFSEVATKVKSGKKNCGIEVQEKAEITKPSSSLSTSPFSASNPCSDFSIFDETSLDSKTSYESPIKENFVPSHRSPVATISSETLDEAPNKTSLLPNEGHISKDDATSLKQHQKPEKLSATEGSVASSIFDWDVDLMSSKTFPVTNGNRGMNIEKSVTEINSRASETILNVDDKQSENDVHKVEIKNGKSSEERSDKLTTPIDSNKKLQDSSIEIMSEEGLEKPPLVEKPTAEQTVIVPEEQQFPITAKETPRLSTALLTEASSPKNSVQKDTVSSSYMSLEEEEKTSCKSPSETTLPSLLEKNLPIASDVSDGSSFENTLDFKAKAAIEDKPTSVFDSCQPLPNVSINPTLTLQQTPSSHPDHVQPQSRPAKQVEQLQEKQSQTARTPNDELPRTVKVTEVTNDPTPRQLSSSTFIPIPNEETSTFKVPQVPPLVSQKDHSTLSSSGKRTHSGLFEGKDRELRKILFKARQILTDLPRVLSPLPEPPKPPEPKHPMLPRCAFNWMGKKLPISTELTEQYGAYVKPGVRIRVRFRRVSKRLSDLRAPDLLSHRYHGVTNWAEAEKKQKRRVDPNAPIVMELEPKSISDQNLPLLNIQIPLEPPPFRKWNNNQQSHQEECINSQAKVDCRPKLNDIPFQNESGLPGPSPIQTIQQSILRTKHNSFPASHSNSDQQTKPDRSSEGVVEARSLLDSPFSGNLPESAQEATLQDQESSTPTTQLQPNDKRPRLILDISNQSVTKLLGSCRDKSFHPTQRSSPSLTCDSVLKTISHDNLFGSDSDSADETIPDHQYASATHEKYLPKMIPKPTLTPLSIVKNKRPQTIFNKPVMHLTESQSLAAPCTDSAVQKNPRAVTIAPCSEALLSAVSKTKTAPRLVVTRSLSKEAAVSSVSSTVPNTPPTLNAQLLNESYIPLGDPSFKKRVAHAPKRPLESITSATESPIKKAKTPIHSAPSQTFRDIVNSVNQDLNKSVSSNLTDNNATYEATLHVPTTLKKSTTKINLSDVPKYSTTIGQQAGISNKEKLSKMNEPPSSPPLANTDESPMSPTPSHSDLESPLSPPREPLNSHKVCEMNPRIIPHNACQAAALEISTVQETNTKESLNDISIFPSSSDIPQLQTPYSFEILYNEELQGPCKEVPPKPKSIKKIRTTVRQAVERLCHAEQFTDEIFNKSVTQLTLGTVRMNSFLLIRHLVLTIIRSFDAAVDTSHTPPLPPLPTVHQRCIALLLVLDEKNRETELEPLQNAHRYSDDFLNEVSHTMFQPENTLNLEEMCSLTRVFVGLCRAIGNLGRARSFLYDCFFFYPPRAYALTYVSLVLWGEILRPVTFPTGLSSVDQTLSFLILYCNKVKAVTGVAGRVTAVRGLLQSYYGYKSSTCTTVTVLLTYLLERLKETRSMDEASSLSLCMAVVARWEGIDWAISTIEKSLWPFLQRWSSGEGSSLSAAAAFITIGLLGKWVPASKRSTVDKIFDAMKTLLQPEVNQAVQEAVIESIILLGSDTRPQDVICILKEWKPEFSISIRLHTIVKAFLKKHVSKPSLVSASDENISATE